MTISSVATIKESRLSYLTILKFYLPLAIGSMIIMSSANIVNSVFSHVPNPQVALAAFAIGLSYAEMVSASTFAGMSMLITLGRDRVYFRNTSLFILKIALTCTLLIGLMAFSPIGEFVATKLGGAAPSLLNDIYTVWRWALLIPLSYYLIVIPRSVLIIEQKTIYLTFAIVVRLVAMLIAATVLPRLGILTGATIGIFMVLIGLIVEGAFSVIPALLFYRRWPVEPDASVPVKNYPPTQRATWSFIAPLIITSLMWGVSHPVLYAGLARMANPEQTIATYRIAFSFIWIFMVLIQDNTKQITVAFLRGHPDNKKIILRFATVLTAIVVVLILIAALTPLGTWALVTFIGVEQAVAMQCLPPILIFATYPLFQVIQEHFQARLLLKGITAPLGVAKACNIATIGISIFVIASFAPQIGAAAGAIAYASGMAIDMLLLRFFALRNNA